MTKRKEKILEQVLAKKVSLTEMTKLCKNAKNKLRLKDAFLDITECRSWEECQERSCV